ncbi:MAG: CHAD domain-containing protein [Pseudomonadota bacterium]
MHIPGPHSEIELKLQIPASALRRLSAHPLLKSRGRAASRKLYSVYFDTPELDLWRQGVALRLRREGKRWVQTVKDGGEVQAGLHRRIEIETKVAGPFPDYAAIDDAAMADLFASPQLREQLKPVFVTEFNRTTRIITPHPELEVEVCVDRGDIRSGARIEAICEIELELKTGPASRLFDLALALLDAVPLRIENRSKAERGYALFQNLRPVPVKSHAAALAADMSVNDAFKAIAWTTLSHLQANERGMREAEDPECLHQMRVALRRLRSAFGIFDGVLPETATAPHVSGLKWLAAALGPARDWDVFMTETLPPIRSAFGEHVGLAAFASQCAQLRLAARRRARRAVNSKRYQRLVLALGGWLTAEAWTGSMQAEALAATRVPVLEFAGTVLERRASQVAKRGRKLPQQTSAQLHCLRIAVKKLRYTADFFASLYDARQVSETLAHLARLQDILGTMNDAAAVSALISQGFGARPGRSVIEARSIMLGWSQGRAATLRREPRAAWKAYRALRLFW